MRTIGNLISVLFVSTLSLGSYAFAEANCPSTGSEHSYGTPSRPTPLSTQFEKALRAFNASQEVQDQVQLLLSNDFCARPGRPEMEILNHVCRPTPGQVCPVLVNITKSFVRYEDDLTITVSAIYASKRGRPGHLSVAPLDTSALVKKIELSESDSKLLHGIMYRAKLMGPIPVPGSGSLSADSVQCQRKEFVDGQEDLNCAFKKEGQDHPVAKTDLESLFDLLISLNALEGPQGPGLTSVQAKAVYCHRIVVPNAKATCELSIGK